jgi:hypothetical protein
VRAGIAIRSGADIAPLRDVIAALGRLAPVSQDAVRRNGVPPHGRAPARPNANVAVFDSR